MYHALSISKDIAEAVSSYLPSASYASTFSITKFLVSKDRE